MGRPTSVPVGKELKFAPFHEKPNAKVCPECSFVVTIKSDACFCGYEYPED